MVVTHPLNSNVVSARSLITDAIHTFNQKDLQIFDGNYASARELAMLDTEEHDVDRILGYSGDPDTRTSLDFYVLFKDGEKHWIKYTADLASTIAFEKYCSGIPCLRSLLLTVELVKTLRKQTLLAPVDIALKGSTMYLNLRIWGGEWYKDLKLPDCFETNYVCQVYNIIYIAINIQKKSYTIKVHVFAATFPVNNWFIIRHGAQRDINVADILVTQDLCKKYGIEPRLR